MNCDVYGVGNALVDIQASVADAVLGKLGFQKGIMTLIDEAMQHRVLEFLRHSRFTQCAGGSAANTVIAVAELGGSAAYSAKVGHDELGDFFLADMRNLGVKVPANHVDPPRNQRRTDDR
jgi:sugar/nucleoside kinase (ribokinase family)